ncbi:WD40 repeat domain-containing protein, partial [bacterium]
LKPEELDQKKTAVVMIWDAVTGELKQKYDLTGDILTDLKFSPDGNLLAADGNEMGVTLWSTATGEKIHTLDDERRPLRPGESRTTEYFGSVEGKPTLAFTADGKHFARSHNGVVKFWNVETGAVEKTITEPQDVQARITSLIALTPDGKTLAMTNLRRGLSLWDVPNDKPLWSPTEKSRVSMMGMSPDGKTLATGSGGEIRLWDISKAAEGIVQ